MQVHYDRDADLSRLRTHKIAILGFGSQGHAHALNLRDSGMDVCVGLRKDSPSWEKAAKQGLPVFETAEAARRADIVMMLVPDEMGSEIYEAEVAPQLTPGKYLAFGHGFNIHFKFIKPAPERQRFHDRAQRPRPSRAIRVRQGTRRALPARGRAGSLGRHQADRARVRIGDRRRTRGDYRNQLSRRDRDRPVRRAIGAVRRTDRADSQRLRNPGRGRLRARDGLFRVRARGKANRRPDLRGRHRQHALLDQQHRRVWRHDARQARGRRRPRARR